MDETWLQKIVHALIFLGISAGIVVVGWNEPLSHRFKSKGALEEAARAETEREASEAAAQSAAADGGTPSSAVEWHAEHGGTALDRGPYVRGRTGRVFYTNEFDRKKLGTPTETDERPFTRRQAPR